MDNRTTRWKAMRSALNRAHFRGFAALATHHSKRCVQSRRQVSTWKAADAGWGKRREGACHTTDRKVHPPH